MSIRNEEGLTQITYKGITHLYNYAFNTDCGISIPSQGNHLKSVEQIKNLNEITCEDCLSTLSAVSTNKNLEEDIKCID